MTHATIIALAEIAGGVVLLAICLQAFFRPRYMISVQKTTNSASQPEVVSYQVNLPWWASENRLWRATEKVAFAGTSRMVTVNEQILDATKEWSEQAAAQRPVLKSKYLRKLERRRREFVAKQRGVQVDQVTDADVQKIVQHTQNGQHVGVGDEGTE